MVFTEAKQGGSTS